MDCQFGALGDLADSIGGFLDEIDGVINKIQNKINQIPALIDAELAKHIADIKQKLEDEFPLLSDLSQLKLALPEEIKNLANLAQDGIAFANEFDKLKEKYKDVDVELLKDPRNITNLLRDIQGDLNRLCDMVPTMKEVEVEECDPPVVTVVKKPNADAGKELPDGSVVPEFREERAETPGECRMVKQKQLRGRGNSEMNENMKVNIEAKSLLKKEGRKAAFKDLKNLVLSFEYPDDPGSGKGLGNSLDGAKYGIN